MFIRILTFVILVSLCGRVAQAGVMVGNDWGSRSAMSTSDNDTLPEHDCPVIEEGSPGSTMGVSTSVQAPSSMAALSVCGSLVIVPSFMGYICQIDRSLPPNPVLGGRLKPA